MNPLIDLPAKRLRAAIIANHMARAGVPRAVCFTCGNAAAALRMAGVDVLEIGTDGALVPTRWWTPTEVAKHFPGAFDATSGHLPGWMMIDLAAAFRRHLGAMTPPTGAIDIQSGSGETAFCMALAYPRINIRAMYNDAYPWSTFSEHAPLNSAVATLCDVVRLNPVGSDQRGPTRSHIGVHVPV